MDHEISPEEAAEALRQIESSKAVFRAAIGSGRGYWHLWLWGCIWIAQCMNCQFLPGNSLVVGNLLTCGGVIASLSFRCFKGNAIRAARDQRFLLVLLTLIATGILWPFILVHTSLGPKASATYSALVAMQCYIIAGIWFDNYLAIIGLITALLVLAGYGFFLPIFWWWMAIFGGGSLIIGGFYIRSRWK